MQGWRPVEDLIRWGFGRAPVVMANEAHNGLARSVRTREMGVRMIRAAHQAGVRRLAMEALSWPAEDTPGPIRAIPSDTEGYLAQPDMRRLITTALDLGWSLWAYEAVFKVTADTDPAELVSMEFTNWREREQAGNLCQLLAATPGEPLLVWCGNSHASKEGGREWVPLATLSETLAAHGGTAGILRDQAPAPLDSWTGVDAVVVSTDNALTEDPGRPQPKPE